MHVNLVLIIVAVMDPHVHDAQSQDYPKKQKVGDSNMFCESTKFVVCLRHIGLGSLETKAEQGQD